MDSGKECKSVFLNYLYHNNIFRKAEVLGVHYSSLLVLVLMLLPNSVPSVIYVWKVRFLY